MCVCLSRSIFISICIFCNEISVWIAYQVCAFCILWRKFCSKIFCFAGKHITKTCEYIYQFCVVCLALLWRLSGVRLEEYFYEKVQGKRPILQVDEGLLGQFMVQAGNQFDAGTPYGKSISTACRLAETRYRRVHNYCVPRYNVVRLADSQEKLCFTYLEWNPVPGPH